MKDTISRRAAIEALEKEKPTPFVNEDRSIDPFGAGQRNQWHRDGLAIMNLPSAQPDLQEYSVWFRIGETLVDVSKMHITAEEGIEKIRSYLMRMKKPERILCKECKYCFCGQCWKSDGLDKLDGNVADDDFCSRAERRGAKNDL